MARGTRLGAAESKQTAALFGGDVELYEATGSGSRGATAAAIQLLSRSKVHIIIGASEADVETLSQFAESHNVLFMNAVSRRGSLRFACRRNTFHVEAADVAYQNAEALERTSGASPPATVRSSVSPRHDTVVLWSSELERFGASQLNARYRARFNAPMNGGAWAGWLAVKSASEAALRSRSAASRNIVRFLEAPSTQLDGHKGWPLSFRRADHQLRQPLYIVVTPTSSANGRNTSIQDVPDIGQLSAGTRDPASLLDRLNARPGSRACSWSPL